MFSHMSESENSFDVEPFLLSCGLSFSRTATPPPPPSIYSDHQQTFGVQLCNIPQVVRDGANDGHVRINHFTQERGCSPQEAFLTVGFHTRQPPVHNGSSAS